MRLQGHGVLAAIVIAAAWSGTASAAANLSCQSAAVTVFGQSQPVANALWQQRVAAKLGKAWSTLSNAESYSVHRHGVLPGPNAVQVSAIPCEVLPPTAAPNAPHPAPP